MLAATPEPLELDSAFYCSRLRCLLAVRVCVLRQSACRRSGTLQLSRGQGTTYPTCAKCPQGAALIDSTPGADRLTWRGAGRGWLGRFEPGRQGRAREAQVSARARLELSGALDPVPCLDEPPREPDEIDG